MKFTSEDMTGEKNPKWKGNNVGYNALHAWVKRQLGKAIKCEECGGSDTVQWANISKEYKRDVSDWKQLCKMHHQKFDGVTKLSRQDANEIRSLYNSGKTQRPIAKMFGVTQMTISNIINNKIKYYA